MFLTILPNCMAPLIVQATLSFSNAILDAAALGFLGMGAQPPTPEWGTMLAEAREFILRAWWVVTFPGSRDPPHRARDQPRRRRPARRPRPQAEAKLTHAAARDREPHRRVQTAHGPSAPSTVSRSPSMPVTCSPSSASRGRASRSPCWRSWACCRDRQCDAPTIVLRRARHRCPRPRGSAARSSARRSR